VGVFSRKKRIPNKTNLKEKEEGKKEKASCERSKRHPRSSISFSREKKEKELFTGRGRVKVYPKRKSLPEKEKKTTT